jgi:Tfp pilus assembly protein PilX
VTLPRRRRVRLPRDERGVALILTLLVLLCLGGLLASYLAVSAVEPQISRNLASASRARYLAEAGIERGFNVLIATSDAVTGWSGLLASATGASPWVGLAGLTNTTVGTGTVSVTVRNDNGIADMPLTGLSASTSPAMDTSAAADANRMVIMRSAGRVDGVTKTIEIVVQRAAPPPSGAASAEPLEGVRALHSITNWREI